eukprot:scaffold19436_cov38-Attheya_sp.AAC.1
MQQLFSSEELEDGVFNSGFRAKVCGQSESVPTAVPTGRGKTDLERMAESSGNSTRHSNSVNSLVSGLPTTTTLGLTAR